MQPLMTTVFRPRPQTQSEVEALLGQCIATGIHRRWVCYSNGTSDGRWRDDASVMPCSVEKRRPTVAFLDIAGEGERERMQP